MIARTLLISAAACLAAQAAGVRSGKAEANWLAAAHEPGKPVRTAVRLVMDEGWHTYWSNPGEGGMRISAKWELPEGWTAGELEHPVPKRFMTGGLAGFGYEGTVLFPVKFTPPAGFTGKAVLRGKISWLTCNDDSCIPGNATLELVPGEGGSGAAEIEAALAKVPQTGEGASLKIVETPKTLKLTLSGLDPKGVAVFPATPQAVDSAAEFDFKKDGETWTAEVAKSEYASGPVKEFTLVFAGKIGAAPRSVTWKAE